MPLGTPLACLLRQRSGDVLAKFRTPMQAVEVVPRLWRRESELLRVLDGRVRHVPRCLADFGEWSLHEYLPGPTLAEVAPSGQRIGPDRLSALAEFFAELAGVPGCALPPRPADWPDDGDSEGFLRWLAGFTEQRVDQANRPRFGMLFDAVGIPRDAVERFLNIVPPPARRPFALLHTDVHRANVLVLPAEEGERLAVIDWELALYGDPLHDLATHLVRMDYAKEEREAMIDLWAQAMRCAGHGEMTADLDRGLRVYRDFEYVQSLYPDVMRAALYLSERPAERELSEAADRVCRALHRAWQPLGLTGEPRDENEVREALRRWHAADQEWRVRSAADGPRGDEPDQEDIARRSPRRRHRARQPRPVSAGRREPTGVPN
ncbi:aminoglycoside phosphotransferase family protein [Streptomyces sp. Go-475]|uniref:phosphotransferase family protein n=1 Tax=Streptomyces sp. Go-475 TaxID=2072505 RepID=UPI001E445AFD|nr:aminoglycoside phosphotransferase family protein [Streptomyces sp. Go-475]